jgi:hypothetical protein
VNTAASEDRMKTYIVLRRRGWQTRSDLSESAKRAESALELAPDDIRWIRSYVVDEPYSCIGMVCVYRATSPEAVRAHAKRARLPVDEIVSVSETLVLEADPVETAA